MTSSTLELGIKRGRSYTCISFILLAIRHYQYISESYVLSQEAAFESSHLAWGTTVIIGIGTKRGLTLNPWKLLSGRTVKGSKVGGLLNA